MDDLLLPRAAPGFSQGLYHPVMGTDLRLQVWAGDDDAAARAEQVALAEVQRLAAVFTTWDEQSELMRWRGGEPLAPSPELCAVLAAAEAWFDASGGAFHPACEALRQRWLRAQAEDALPTRAELQRLADGLRDLPWRMVGPVPERRGDCSGADLNAFVKGWIVDAALAAARREVPGVTRIGINAGGDLRHAGDGTWRVGVEDPLRPADNRADRLCTVGLSNAAIASSGLARRGFRVAGQWFGHVLDPRTGWPVEHVAQVSVVAMDTATADVLATVCGVLPSVEGIDFVTAQPGAEALVVAADGTQHRTPGWDALLV